MKKLQVAGWLKLDAQFWLPTEQNFPGKSETLADEWMYYPKPDLSNYPPVLTKLYLKIRLILQDCHVKQQ
jgi:hypothetical protein